MLIVIEGIDGSGKDALADGLAEALGYERFSFPDYETDLGQHIKAHLIVAECYPAEVFQAMQVANKLEHVRMLTEARDHIRNVVLTRYWQSAEVYGAIDGVARGWSRLIHATLPEASFNFLADVNPEESIRRQRERARPLERYEGKVKTMTQARDLYLQIWAEYAGPRWPVVSSDGTKVETLAQVMKHLHPYVAPRRYQ